MGTLRRDKMPLLAEKLFDSFVGLLRASLKDQPQRVVAEQIGCSQSQISRWLSGERGRNVSLRLVLRAYRKLGGDMSEVLSEVLGENRAATILSVGDDDPEFFDALIELISSRDEDFEKLRSDVLYYKKKRAPDKV